MLKKIYALITFSLFLLLFAAEVQAAGPPGPPMGPPPCWPPPCVIPIDGGISFLIVAGIALGGKKIYDFSKRAA